jgi:hypothetical protein
VQKGLKILRKFIQFGIVASVVLGKYVYITRRRVSGPLVVIIIKLGQGVCAGLAFALSVCPK